jgi:hypothetical protein
MNEIFDSSEESTNQLLIARLYTRLDLKRAAGWLTEHEENEILNRLKEIDGSESITKNTDD